MLTLEDTTQREYAVADATEVLRSLQRRLRALRADDADSAATDDSAVTVAVDTAKLAELEEWAASTVRPHLWPC
eukprot:1196414-Prorocentrum_minimum.AAC.1